MAVQRKITLPCNIQAKIVYESQEYPIDLKLFKKYKIYAYKLNTKSFP